MSLEVNTPLINASMVNHLKFGEGEKVLGKQIVSQGEEAFWSPRFPVLIQANNEKEAWT
jgi:hypothetical protein